ncbi:UDP-N-acetylmuramate dehydrogenase [uncultured Cytophaga sp.]|uniref:UDP-N-acetylmuramate dehydrogenase n=1 Tax=uncultured Cytophaga sp. TaxID=160238 RepID=UPI00261E00D6|nr:UDP-N-acetylmuramate dehydrogenase [uncultured Cytophaga sp.]
MKATIESNKNLKKYNTFSISVSAEKFSIFKSETELLELLESIKKHNLPLLILGGGSNILFTSTVSGYVLKNEILGKQLLEENSDSVLVKCGAGEVWHEFVIYCVNKGWAGLENLSLIPGTVGACPIQNIGAYGVEVKDTIESVECIEIETGLKKRFTNTDCLFGYRDSIFKNILKGKYVITQVAFRLKKQSSVNISYGAIQQILTEKGITVPNIRDVSRAVVEIRRSKLPNPAQLGNAGSFFKNPEIPLDQFNTLKITFPDIVSYPGTKEGMIKLPAGWLIEKSGWKGKTVGNVGVHRLQALVIVNYGGATGNEIIELSNEIRKSVFDLFQIDLLPEVNII